ncbi:hypothetical protein GCM10027347_59870 [Larkinella harenae]
MPPPVWDTSHPWTETQVRRYIVAKLRKEPGYNRDWLFAGDMAGELIRAGDSEETISEQLINATLVGLEAGEPDLRFYLSCGRTLLVELKLKRWGGLSSDQRARIRKLRRLGHDAGALYCESPWHGFERIMRMINRRNRLPWWHRLF